MRRVRSRSGKALYRVLPRSVAGMSAEQVAFDQRTRLQGAMVAAVARDGYQEVTIKQLVALAGVSKSGFYKHFENKQALYLATFDLIVAMASERISAAYRSKDDWQAQMRAAFSCFAEILAQEPDAARLVLIDSLAAGDRALAHRQQATQTFEAMLAQSYARAPEPAQVTPLSVQTVIAGIRHIAYRRLLADEPGRLGEHTEDLLAWALSYHAPNLTPPQHTTSAKPKSKRKTSRGAEHGCTRSAVAPDAEGQTRADGRQRILDAIVTIANRDGYAALSMPLIARTAGTSNETFYEHFPDKQAAFLTAFWETVARGMTPILEAFTATQDWPKAIHASITTLLTTVAADEAFARMAFFSILTAGRAGTDTAEQALDHFAGMFTVENEQRPNIPIVISEALVGALWATIARELEHGRQAQLPQLANEIIYIILTPFIGAEHAIEIARTPAAV